MTHSQLFTDFVNGFYEKIQLKLLENVYYRNLEKYVKLKGLRNE